MTSKNCSKAYHPCLRLFAHTLRRQTGITLLFSAFMLVICPGILWKNVADWGYQSYSMSQELHYWFFLVFLMAMILGVVLLCYNHTHLFSKRSADLYYALPVKRDALLFLRAGSAFVGASFAMTLSFGGLVLVNALPYVNGCPAGTLFELYVLGLLMLLLCMSTVLIFITNAGSIFHFIFSLLVICIGIPLLCVIAIVWYESASYGVTANLEWMKYTSPFFYAALSLLNQTMEGEAIGSAEPTAFLIGLGATVLFCAIAFLLHHNRKTEKAESSFAYSIAPVLITALTACLGGYLLGLIFSGLESYGIAFWVAFSVGAVLVALASGAIISKGFRKIWRWFLCAGAAITLMLILFLCVTAFGRNRAEYIPPEDEILSVTLTGDYRRPDVTFTEDLSKIRQLHIALNREADETNREYAYSDVIGGDVDLIYHMKDGSTVKRSYWHQNRESLTLQWELMCREEYAEAWDFSQDTDGFIYVSGYSYQHDRNFAEALTLTQAEALIQTYLEDLRALSPEEIIHEGSMAMELELETESGWYRLSLTKAFVKTLSLLEDYTK